MAGLSEPKKETQYNFSSYITAYALHLRFQNICLNAAQGNGRSYCVRHIEHTNTRCDKAAQLLNIKVRTCVATTGLPTIKCFFYIRGSITCTKNSNPHDNITVLKVTQNPITS